MKSTEGSPVIITLAQLSAGSAQPAADSPEARDSEFRAVEGGGVQASGELLLIEAYAAIWLLVFALVFMSIRKQRKLDDRIERLSEDLAKVRDKGGG